MAESRNVILHGDPDAVELSEDSRSMSDTFSSTKNGNDKSKNDFSPEMQQAYRIFQSFLLEKHKAVIAQFWSPVGDQIENDMCLKKIESKFGKREYESITDFVADFRLMLENCYRFHGVDHWISKQAQKLELMLEQKLTLLSRTLREKTTLAVTSRGRFNTEDEKSQLSTSNRRRSVPRNLAPITVGGSESVMVQALRWEEQQKAKEEKRQRELEKKEAEGLSAKEVEEWESSLLSLAEPWSINTMWELPAIGHFLCLAQKALNLPEIVFFELERCLLMPRCSSFLAKIMTSLLHPAHRRTTLHKRPALSYRRWEAELRQRVSGWYQSIGRAKDQEACAEQLGLCHRFFWTLGETSPLEEKPFHLLAFNQRVWLLKALCDNVYETQKDVQDAVLGQPIHECRESILGYDSQENAYIHFPHFCGADLRIYRQSPCTPLDFPLPAFHVKKLAPKVAIQEYLGHSLKEEEQTELLCLRGNKDDSLRDNCLKGNELDAKGSDECWFPLKESDLKGISEEPMDLEQNVDLEEERLSKNNLDHKLPTSIGKKCSKKVFLAYSFNTNTLKSLSLPESDVQRHKDALQDGPCPKCPTMSAHFEAEFGRTNSVVPQQPRHFGVDTGTKCSPKYKRKKKRERSFRLKKLRRCGVNNTRCNAIANLKRKKWKKPKIGKKDVSSKTNEKREETLRLPVEPTFKLVCTSVEELRALIGKTEDELDELASIKKRCGRRSVKQDTVRELHLTLIRLLNELLPWEPKLLKAFQKNRARLKKENEDFKKLPEYNNFIREEPVVAEEERVSSNEGSSSETNRDAKADEESRTTLNGTLGERGIESTGFSFSRPDVNTTISVSRPLTRSSKLFQSACLYDNFSLGVKVRSAGHDPSNPEPPFEVSHRDQMIADANNLETAPLGTLQRRCKPIQALLAKSVGNKVTLLSHPQNTAAANILKLPSKAISVAKPITIGPSTSQSIAKPDPRSAPQAASAPSKILTSSSLSAQGPVQIVYKLPGGSSLIQNDGTSVQPITEQDTGKEVSQQLFILPSNLLIQNTESLSTQQSISIKHVASPISLLTSTCNVSAPENQSRIPVQQVAPLYDSNLAKPPSVSNHHVPSTILPNPPPPPSVSVDPNKSDLKQELKTVCIRDSQSILVTTRGGNTGVVKVQTSDKSGACVLPPGSVFTIPPQIPTFLTPSLIDKGNLFKYAPQSPLKSVRLPNSSFLIEKQGGIVTLNKDVPTPIEPLSINRASANVHEPIHPAAFKNQTKPSLKRSQVTSIDQDQSAFSKVFLLTPTTSCPQSESSTTDPPVPSVITGSRVGFMSQSGSACSTLSTFTKDSVRPGSTVAQPAIEIMSVGPHPGKSITTSTTSTQVHGINVSGLTARILNESSNAVVSAGTKVGPGMGASASSSRLVFVQNANTGANSTSAPNAKVSLLSTACLEGKPVTLTTLNSGHMSSALVSEVHQKSMSLLVSKPDLILPPASDSALSSLGNSVLLNSLQTKGLTEEKPWVPSSISTPSIVTSVPVICQTVSPKMATASQQVSSLAKSPLNAIPGVTKPQERVVINTSVPLAPGTQLLINNTRFVVPAQGLGPGSHILVISNPGLPPLGPIQRAAGAQIQSPHTSIRLPAPVTAKIGTSISSQQVLTPAENAQTSGQPGLPSVIRLPSFLHTEDKRASVPSLQSVFSWPTPSTAQKHSPSVATPTKLQTSLLSLAPKPRVTPATPSLSSTGSKAQTLPVATVPPNVGTVTSHETSCVTTVNKLLMATCQPVGPIQPGNIQPLQVPAQKAPHTPSKLLLSPDGAVLNVLTSPVLQNLPVLPSVEVLCTSNTTALTTIDSLSIQTSDTPLGPSQ